MTRRALSLALLTLIGLLTSAGLPAPSRAQGVLDEVAGARRLGEDERALTLLDHPIAQVSEPRRAAERGLAYQGAGLYVDAERALVRALATTADPWVTAHRAGLDLALQLTRERLGWLIVACDAPGTRASFVDGPTESFPCGLAQRVIAGAQRIETRAPNRRSARAVVQVGPGGRERYSVQLSPFECASEGMLHTGGDHGRCCWPGQGLDDAGACEGTPSCPPNTRAEQLSCIPTQRTGRGLARLEVGAFAGVASFISADTGLFRSGVDSSGSSTQLGGRLELRIGARLYGPLSAAVIVGGSRQDVNQWIDCGGASGCVDTGPTAYGVDVGLMLQLHTNPRRHLGAFDLHVGAGVRPFAQVSFDSPSAATSKLTATVIPAELGLSFFLGSALSIDLLGQGELWLPREYCGTGADGTRSCLGSSELTYEFGWSALLGLSLHLGG
ncbi:MAG: hypothetical protein GXP55_19500 [Deltaproteobacteria bacterium]|nr:hypothetical protein [Deltaproteobacteria bacterium]